MKEKATWRPQPIENPLTVAVRGTVALYASLDFAPAMFVPSLVSAAVVTLVLALEVVLWPYGLIPVIASFMWSFVQHSAEQIRGTQSYMQKMPFTVSAGIYFVMWLPFGVLCLPFVVVGAIGEWLARQSSQGDREAQESSEEPDTTVTEPSSSLDGEEVHVLDDRDITASEGDEQVSQAMTPDGETVVSVGWDKL